MEVIEPADSGQDTGNTGETGIRAALDRAQQQMQEDDDVGTNAALAAKGAAQKDLFDNSETAEPPAPAKVPELAAAKIEAPQHWSAERKQAFAGLAPDAQKALLTISKDLEGGYTKRSMELSDKVKYADSISGLFNEADKSQQSQAGLDEVGYVRYLHSIQKFATSDPARYVAWAMQNLGVSPEQLGLAPRGVQQGQQQSDGTGDAALDDLLMDPALKQLKTQIGQYGETIQQLQQRLEAQDNQARQYTQQQQQAAQRALVGAWNEFRTQIDDHGQLAHPHADAVMQRMGAIMETDPKIATMRDGPEKLSAAYDAAVWADQDLRSTRLDTERERAAAEAAKTQEAERAKRSAGPRRALGAPVVPEKRGGIAGAIAAAQARLGQA